MLGYLDDGVPHIGDIRLLMLIQRSGNADCDKVALADNGEVAGCAKHS
ncbi:hypothetical protein SDC9_143359 [bioreactor metagenome]|uniref:Uncharacterized protein n=1 Tax=bioreactor metagenome TaxID=1076179 RepID=A0A645E3R9_9ZZZZ